MGSVEVSRFYPAGADAVYRALRNAVQRDLKVRSRSDFARSVSFETKGNAWSSGANATAHVVPEGEYGCTVRMEAQPKIRTQIKADNAAHNQLVAVLDEIGRTLEAAVAKPEPPLRWTN